MLILLKTVEVMDVELVIFNWNTIMDSKIYISGNSCTFLGPVFNSDSI